MRLRSLLRAPTPDAERRPVPKKGAPLTQSHLPTREDNAPRAPDSGYGVGGKPLPWKELPVPVAAIVPAVQLVEPAAFWTP